MIVQVSFIEVEDSGEVSDVADAADPIKHTLIMDLKQGVDDRFQITNTGKVLILHVDPEKQLIKI